jgi:hypothetical protein
VKYSVLPAAPRPELRAGGCKGAFRQGQTFFCAIDSLVLARLHTPGTRRRLVFIKRFSHLKSGRVLLALLDIYLEIHLDIYLDIYPEIHLDIQLI